MESGGELGPQNGVKTALEHALALFPEITSKFNVAPTDVKPMEIQKVGVLFPDMVLPWCM